MHHIYQDAGSLLHRCIVNYTCVALFSRCTAILEHSLVTQTNINFAILCNSKICFYDHCRAFYGVLSEQLSRTNGIAATATRLELDGLWFDPRWGKEIFASLSHSEWP
jgi:hypothetical protein